jgi:hypothetical protein
MGEVFALRPAKGYRMGREFVDDRLPDRSGGNATAGFAWTAGWLTLPFLALAAGGFGARALLTPASFGADGHYRKSAIEENRSLPSRHTGSGACRECHPDQHRFWAYGKHAAVACEACHGAGAEHSLKDAEPRPKLSLEGNDQCLGCHGRAAGRPEKYVSLVDGFDAHLRFIEHKHFVNVDRAKKKNLCVHCHDPHLLQ